MQLVIDINEEYYEMLKYDVEHGNDYVPVKLIANGTPLPKGHGRLIDADIIKDFKNKIKDYKKDYKFTHEEIFNILERYEIKYAPTIIEADKESGS